MPAENEEIDVFKNRKWHPFVNTLRGASALHDNAVLREFDRTFVPSLRRAFKLLKVKELIAACINGDLQEVNQLRLEHRRQRDRAETFADLIVSVCKPGMTVRAAMDAFVHGACFRIIDQAALVVVPSDNFPTLDDYRQTSAIWLFRMEPRISQIVEQAINDPAKLKVESRSREERYREADRELGSSLLDSKNKDHGNGSSIPDNDQER